METLKELREHADRLVARVQCNAKRAPLSSGDRALVDRFIENPQHCKAKIQQEAESRIKAGGELELRQLVDRKKERIAGLALLLLDPDVGLRALIFNDLVTARDMQWLLWVIETADAAGLRLIAQDKDMVGFTQQFIRTLESMIAEEEAYLHQMTSVN